MYNISTINELIDSYHFSLDKSTITILSNKLDQMIEKRPRFKMIILINYSSYSRLNYLSNLSIRRIRKQLLLVEQQHQCIEFNNTLKDTLTYKFIHKYNKDYWISHILELISKNARNIITEVENYSGINSPIERSRIEEDYRVRYDYSEYNTSHTSYDTKESEKEWSEKIKCTCIKDLGSNSFMKYFKNGRRYDYRTNIENGQIVVYYTNESSLIFEDGSFQEYFITRDRFLDYLLNNK